MIPIWGSRRNFQTIPIVASDEITGKKYTERKNLLTNELRCRATANANPKPTCSGTTSAV